MPVGTIVKNAAGQVVGDLNRKGLMFVAARGGAGGKGNRFFTTEAEQAPKVCEYGAPGEDLAYVVELRSMAHIGLVGIGNSLSLGSHSTEPTSHPHRSACRTPARARC